ncbi:sensor histidine kinase [Nocardioides sp.]|uniref:sensor histidine kinase n=1 Tax=Nocardioides sp. TaxID=35761 RepID=UPI003516C7F9
MAHDALDTRGRVDLRIWSDAASRDALDLVVASAPDMVGFDVATISVLWEDQLITVAVQGPTDLTQRMLGVGVPLPELREELEPALRWGRFSFLPAERAPQPPLAHDWIPDLPATSDPDRWHPHDLLCAWLYDEVGALIGLAQLDMPHEQRRPASIQRLLLQRWAVQAERALRQAVQREELAERIRLAEAARQVVRIAVAEGDLEAVLTAGRDAVLTGFRSDLLGLHLYPPSGVGVPFVATGDETLAGRLEAHLMLDGPEFLEQMRARAAEAWRRQETVLLSADVHADADPVERAAAERLRALGLHAAVFAPIGAGQEHLGDLLIARADTSMVYTPDERRMAAEIARDLGQAVVNARTLAREQAHVQTLQALSTAKSRLLTTVSHELRNPLAAILGHAEVLEDALALGQPAPAEMVQAITRAAHRMTALVDDLLALAAAEDPGAPPPTEVLDLVDVVRHLGEDAARTAERAGLDLVVDLPPTPVPVRADAHELARALINLLDNALKYTPADGRVAMCVQHAPGAPEVVVVVADTGIGIAPEDLDQLFTDFFRSSNALALEQPGTGLGLAITQRIVTRHGGRVTVSSTLGEGTEFRVHLPLA